MCISVYSVLSYYTCNSCDINGGQQLMGNSLSGSLPYTINIIELHCFIYCYVAVNNFRSLSILLGLSQFCQKVENSAHTICTLCANSAHLFFHVFYG